MEGVPFKTWFCKTCDDPQSHFGFNWEIHCNLDWTSWWQMAILLVTKTSNDFTRFSQVSSLLWQCVPVPSLTRLPSSSWSLQHDSKQKNQNSPTRAVELHPRCRWGRNGARYHRHQNQRKPASWQNESWQASRVPPKFTPIEIRCLQTILWESMGPCQLRTTVNQCKQTRKERKVQTVRSSSKQDPDYDHLNRCRHRWSWCRDHCY